MEVHREREPEIKAYHGINLKQSRQKVRDDRCKGHKKEEEVAHL